MKNILYWSAFTVPSIVIAVWFVYQFDAIEYGNFVYNQNQFGTEEKEKITVVIPGLNGATVDLAMTELPNAEKKYFGEFSESVNGFMNIGTVVLINEYAYSISDFKIIPMSVNYGGSGNFFYIALFDENLKHLDSLLVDADIDIKGFEQNINDYAFRYLSHHISQARTEDPIVDTRLHFFVKDGELIEFEKYFNSFEDFSFIEDNLQANSIRPASFGFSFEARGWLFENTSSAKLYDEDYELLDSNIADSRNGEWMTSNFVTISSDLDAGEYNGKARVVLEADNASGIPKHDKRVEFWIYIK